MVDMVVVLAADTAADTAVFMAMVVMANEDTEDTEEDAEDAVEVRILDSAVVVPSPTAEPMPVR